jgi:SNF family Na+-dependent transporter
VMVKEKKMTTILTICMGFTLVYLITNQSIFLKLSLGIGLLSLLSSYIAEKIDFLWSKLSWVLSKIVPNIILSLLFFLFITPIAFASRVFAKKDALRLSNKYDSLFEDYNKEIKPDFFEKTW